MQTAADTSTYCSGKLAVGYKWTSVDRIKMGQFFSHASKTDLNAFLMNRERALTPTKTLPAVSRSSCQCESHVSHDYSVIQHWLKQGSGGPWKLASSSSLPFYCLCYYFCNSVEERRWEKLPQGNILKQNLTYPKFRFKQNTSCSALRRWRADKYSFTTAAICSWEKRATPMLGRCFFGKKEGLLAETMHINTGCQRATLSWQLASVGQLRKSDGLQEIPSLKRLKM